MYVRNIRQLFNMGLKWAKKIKVVIMCRAVLPLTCRHACVFVCEVILG